MSIAQMIQRSEVSLVRNGATEKSRKGEVNAKERDKAEKKILSASLSERFQRVVLSHKGKERAYNEQHPDDLAERSFAGNETERKHKKGLRASFVQLNPKTGKGVGRTQSASKQIRIHKRKDIKHRERSFAGNETKRQRRNTVKENLSVFVVSLFAFYQDKTEKEILSASVSERSERVILQSNISTNYPKP